MIAINSLKSRVAVLLVAFVCVFALTLDFGTTKVQAQEVDTEELQAQIDELLQLVADLQAQITGLEEEVTELNRNLSAGLSGEDVEELQELLASDSELYPEGLVTGYYGPLTEAAVRRFQERFGIEQVGVVGPITRGTLNRLLRDQQRGLGNAFERVTFDMDEDDDEENDMDNVDLSEFTPGTTGVLVCHMPPGNPSAMHTIAVGGPAVQAHLGHGDELGACEGDDLDDEEEDEEDEEEDEDESDEESAEEAIEDAEDAIEDAQNAIDEANDDDLDTDDAQDLLDDAQDALDDAVDSFNDEDYDDAETLAEEAEELAEDAEDALPEDEDDDEEAPEIENVDAEVTSSTTATITWETDEDADSTVWYSTDEGFDVDDAGVEEESDSDLVEDHSIDLDNLDPDTTYYYIVGSEDDAGNEAQSDEEFTTSDE